MRNIRITVQYDGHRYLGWQRQKDPERTIQGKLEGVLSRMAGERTTVIGASRTDAGAHAQAQIANFHTECPLPADEILDYCYQYLPQDIVVTGCADVEERFHARATGSPANSTVTEFGTNLATMSSRATRRFMSRSPSMSRQ